MLIPLSKYFDQAFREGRIAMRIGLLLFVASVTLAFGLRAEAQPVAERPNIVLIISDDQAWTDYGFMGHEHIETPNLDRLARESLLFTRGYVPNSLCRPSLASIITGQYPHQHGIVGNDPPVPDTAEDLPGRRWAHPAFAAAREEYLQHIDRADTLPDRLAPLGYASFQAGKWWEGHYSRGGFTEGMTHGDVKRGGRHGDEGLAIGRQGLEPIAQFIRKSREQKQPFFVWYAPMLPHMPHNPPEELLNKYLPRTESQSIAKYWAMCEWFDQTCGKLLELLEREGIAENTLVLYVTDNGWITDPEESRYAPKSKRSPYDGGLRTPVMVRWPGKVAPRRDETTLVSSLDIVPTLLAAAGAEIPDELPGLDLRNEQELAQRKQLFGEIFEHDVQHMTDPRASLMYRWTIQDQWKLIVPTAERVPDGSIELYDLAADPHETRNLAAEHPQRVEQLLRDLDRWWP